MAKPKRRERKLGKTEVGKSSSTRRVGRSAFSGLAPKQRITALGLASLLILGAVAGVTAKNGWFGGRPTRPVAQPEPPTPQGGSLTLAKEYIYGPGGRILAIEEPTLNAPTNLQLTNYTGSTLTLSWNDNSSNEDGFRIERSADAGTPTIITVAPNVTTLTDSFLPRSCMSYVVSAFTGSILSEGVGIAACPNSSPCPTVSTLSGSTFGYVEGTGAAARWNSPTGGVVAKDPANGLITLFVTDTTNHRIRKICLEGANAGTSSLVAGTGLPGYTEGSGVALNARYNYPRGITAVVDGAGTATVLYIADTSNHMIRKLAWNGSGWTSSKLAGVVQPGAVDSNVGGSVRFNAPQGVTVAPNGFVYVADTGNGRIRRVDQAQGATTTLVNSGIFNSPIGIAASSSSQLYVTDSVNHRVYQVTTSGLIAVIAGSGTPGFADGVGTAAVFNSPNQLVYVNSAGVEALFIADRNNNRIRMLLVSNSSVTAYGGTGAAGYADGNCATAQFKSPGGVAYSSSTNLTYVIDTGNHRIRVVQ